ncbi:MAG: hypothetical protein ACK56F_07720 [bacterium]
MCLSDQEMMVAPQITECGHIFCFVCFLQHQALSTNRFNCPVCTHIVLIDNLKSAKIHILPARSIGDTILMNLLAKHKYQEISNLIDVQTGNQDILFSKF